MLPKEYKILLRKLEVDQSRSKAHFSIKCVSVFSHAVVSDSLQSHGSSGHGILQARILEWVAMPSSMGSSPPVDRTPRLLCLLHRQADSLPLAPPGKPEARDPPKSPPDLTLPARLFLGSLLLPTSTSQCKKKSSVTVCPESEVAQLCPTLCDPVDLPTTLLQP